MERAITLRDKVSNAEIRRRTRVDDTTDRKTKLKWSWAGHIARTSDESWTRN